MNLEKIDKNNTSIIKYSKTDNVLNDICSIINSARDYAFQSVNLALIERILQNFSKHFEHSVFKI